MSETNDKQLQENTPMSLQESLAVLSKRSDIYPEEALHVVLSHADEARPYLYEALDNAIRNGKNLDEDYQLHFYSLFILGELKDSGAFEKILSLVS